MLTKTWIEQRQNEVALERMLLSTELTTDLLKSLKWNELKRIYTQGLPVNDLDVAQRVIRVSQNKKSLTIAQKIINLNQVMKG